MTYDFKISQFLLDPTNQIHSYIIKDENHERGKANLDYYKRALREATEKLRGDVGDTALSAQTDSKENPFEFKNPRPESPLGYERDNYEYLCRQEYKVNFWSRFLC